MEPMGETCRDVPCISVLDFRKVRKDSSHGSNAHHLFDGMPCPFELYEEDVILIMNEEKVSRDKAISLLLEEWMDAKRRMDEKLD
uniref:Uncharacterized protein n=1 Tax=Leersia perrieri TaxID=77586 RepID=A0A0D9XJL2_9ORYZ